MAGKRRQGRPLTLVQLPIATGIDAGVDPKVSEVPIIIENGVYKRRGAISKRPGQNQATYNLTGVSTPDPDRIVPYQNGAVVYGGGSIHALSSGLENVANTIDVSNAHTVLDVDVMARGRADSEMIGGDAFKSDSIIATFNMFLGSGSIETYDIESGSLIQQASYSFADSGGVFVEIGAGTGTVRAYWREGTDLASAPINTTTGVIGTKVTTNLGMGVGVVDACCIENSAGNPFVAVVYYHTASAEVRVSMCESGLFSTINTATVETFATIRRARAVYAVSDTEAMVLWSRDTGTNTIIGGEVYDTSASSTVAAATVETWNDTTEYQTEPHFITGINYNATGSGDLGTVLITLRDITTASNPPYTTIVKELQNSASTVAITTSTDLFRHQLATKPMVLGNTYVVGIFYSGWGPTGSTETRSSSDQFVWMVQSRAVSTIQLRPCGRSNIGRAYPFIDSATPNPPDMLPGGAGISAFAMLQTSERIDFSDWFSPTPTSWTRNTYDITADVNNGSYVEQPGGYAILAGSIAKTWAGSDRASAAGFIPIPEPIHITDAAGAMPAGTYDVKAVYERIDEAGNRYQSAPTSVAFTISIAVNRLLNVVVPSDTITYEQAVGVRCRIVLYMTDGQGGTIFRKAATGTNNPLVSEVTVQITAVPSDTDERLYTTDGTLANEEYPPHTVATVWNNRYICFDTDEKVIRYSKVRFNGEPFNHNAALQLQIDSDGGNPTAMATLSDKLCIFKRSSIYVTEGVGYDDTGGGSNFVRPYLVSPAVGCIDQRSVIRTPSGIMFESADGIWILGNDFVVKPIGDKVRHYVETHGPITGTADLKSKTYAVFSTAAGPALVYNWLRDQWSTWSNFSSKSITTILNDTLIARISGTNLLYTDLVNFDDNAAYIAMRVRTGWISKDDVGGWFRLKEIIITGHRIQSHTMRIKVAYDNEANGSGPIWVDDETIAPSLVGHTHVDFYDAGTSTTQTANAYSLTFQPSYSKCSSFMIELSDEQVISADEGWDISAISILIQPHPAENVKHVGSTRQITG